MTKGAVYHNFSDKAALFEATYVAMEEGLLSEVLAAIEGIDDPFRALLGGADVFLEACCRADFRRIALEEAPVALGRTRWRATEEKHFLGLVRSAIEALSEAGLVDVPRGGDLTARMLLAALNEAGLSVAPSPDPRAERERAHDLIDRIVSGLRRRGAASADNRVSPLVDDYISRSRPDRATCRGPTRRQVG